jgi:uncharacterized protein
VKAADADILVIPGLGNSGPQHWQRRWASRLQTARVVEQEEWENPQLEPWVRTISHAIMMATRPVVLVAHSLGVSAVVHTAQRLKDTKVRGAFLVSPPDHEGETIPPEAQSFAPVPRDPLPFPSVLVASTNDELVSPERAADFASAWGSELHFAGPAGHINAASGHGPWPEGLLMLTKLLQRIKG